MDNRFAVLGEKNTSSEDVLLVETDERATELQGFSALAGDNILRIGDPFPPAYPSTRVQLLALSQDRFAYVTSTSTVCLGMINDLENALLETKVQPQRPRFEPSTHFVVDAPISHIAFSADGTRLYVCAASGGLLTYKVDQIHAGREELQIPALIELLPNPVNASLALLSCSNDLIIVSETGLTTIASRVSAISWSKKGKQIVAGITDGTIKQYTPQGELKADLRPPPQHEGPVTAINWLENNLFTIAFLTSEEEITVYILRRAKVEQRQTLTYTSITNPSLSFGDTSHPAHYTFLPVSKTLVLTASSASADVGLISVAHTASLSIDDDIAKAVLRFSPDREAEVSITGVAIQTDTQRSRTLVWYTDNDGCCGAWQIRDDENPLIEDTSELSGFQAVGPASFQPPVTHQTSNPSPFVNHLTTAPATSAPSPFQIAQSGTLPKSMFGTNKIGTLGTTTSTPTFGSPAAFGNTAFGSSAFGSLGGPSSSQQSNSFGGFDGLKLGTQSKQNIFRPQEAVNHFPVEPKLESARSYRQASEESDEEIMQEDKPAQLDEQEPSVTEHNFSIEQVSTMSFGQDTSHDLSRATKPAKQSTLALQKSGSALAAPEATAGVEIRPRQSAFGSFSFPTPTAGGFGFTANDNSLPISAKTDNHTETQKDAPMITRPAQGQMSQQSFGLAKSQTSSSQSNVTSCAIPTFTFGQSAPSASVPVDEPVRSSSGDVIGLPKQHSSTEEHSIPQVQEDRSLSTHSSTARHALAVSDDASLPPGSLITEVESPGAHEAAIDPDVKSLVPQAVSHEEDFDKSKDSSATNCTPLNEPADGTAHSQVLENHSDLGADSGEHRIRAAQTASELKNIPPFNFSHVGQSRSSTDTVDSSYIQVSSEENLVQSEKSPDGDRSPNSLEASFARFIEQSDDESQSSSKLQSESEGAEAFDENEDNASEWTEGDNHEPSESDDAQAFKVSAFATKTPAFAASPGSDARQSPFSRELGNFSFLADSPSPSISGVKTKSTFDFVQAAKTSQGSQSQTNLTKQFASSQPIDTSLSASTSAPIEASFVNTSSFLRPLASSGEPVSMSKPINKSMFPTPLHDEAKPNTDMKSSGGSNAKTLSMPVKDVADASVQTILSLEDNPRTILREQRSTLKEVAAALTKPLSLPEYIPMNTIRVSSTTDQGLAREMHNLTDTLTLELNLMGKNLDLVSSYVEASKILPQSLDNVMGLASEVEAMTKACDDYNSKRTYELGQITSINYSMFRLEDQKVKVQRLIRAQTDPRFAEALKISNLGPEQAAQQRDLRRMLGLVETDLENFQSSLTLCKAKLTSQQAGKALPTAANITVALQKIMRAVHEKERTVDELQKKLIAVQLAASNGSQSADASPKHILRRSQARYSVDDSFDHSLSQLSLGPNSRQTWGKSSNVGSSRQKELRAAGERKRRLMRVYKEARDLGSTIQTIPLP